MGIIPIVIISAIAASFFSSILNRNTIGTQEAYFKRWFGIFALVAFLLMSCS